jgi:hypothetical protein
MGVGRRSEPREVLAAICARFIWADAEALAGIKQQQVSRWAKSLAGSISAPRDLWDAGRGNSVQSILVMSLPVVMVAPWVVITSSCNHVGANSCSSQGPTRNAASQGSNGSAKGRRPSECSQRSLLYPMKWRPLDRGPHRRGLGGLGNKTNPAKSDASGHNQIETRLLHVLLQPWSTQWPIA